MAHCTQPNCPWKGTRKGLLIHLGRMHGIRRDYDSDSNELASESKQCPVPGCGQEVGDLGFHLSQVHEDWRLSSGKWVFEA